MIVGKIMWTWYLMLGAFYGGAYARKAWKEVEDFHGDVQWGEVTIIAILTFFKIILWPIHLIGSLKEKELL